MFEALKHWQGLVLLHIVMHLTEKFIDSVCADGKYEDARQAISLVVAETRDIVVGWGRHKMGA